MTTETKRWAVAILVSMLVAFGGNYWLVSLNQARIDERLSTAERNIVDMKAIDMIHDKRITDNTIASVKATEIMEALVTTTTDLNRSVTRLTDVVTRLDERSRIKNETH